MAGVPHLPENLGLVAAGLPDLELGCFSHGWVPSRRLRLEECKTAEPPGFSTCRLEVIQREKSTTVKPEAKLQRMPAHC